MFDFLAKKPRVRMAPSPTGNLHIGTARTTLFNYLFAKKTGGTFVLRIEDTDKERSKPEYEQNLIDGLTWLGLDWDEFYRQSERTSIYVAAIKKLIDSGKAYLSKEPAKDNPEKEVEVVRLRNPGGTVTFTDLVRGEITTDVADLGDFVIARAIDDPLYHLAVVVDDGEMGITHVIRGEDHISNTPRQILLLEALGYARPQYAHLALILAADRSKMSKRHGATSVDAYRAAGFLPEGMINFLALMGWNPGTEQEIFSLDELASAFDLAQLQKSGAVFDMDRFTWFNREHIKRLSDSAFADRLTQFGATADPRLVPLLKERSSTLKEAADLLLSDEFSFLTTTPSQDAALLVPRLKDREVGRGETAARLGAVLGLLEALPASPFSAQAVKEAVWPYAESEGKGVVLWPMRVALSGKERSPDPFTIAQLLGKEETLARLAAAQAAL